MGVYIDRLEMPKTFKQAWICYGDPLERMVNQDLYPTDLLHIDIVRCGECQWWKDWICSRNGEQMTNVDFCSKGEPKNE